VGEAAGETKAFDENFNSGVDRVGRFAGAG
jgi:hypothetical protein